MQYQPRTYALIQRPEDSGKIDILRKVAAQGRIIVADIIGRPGERSEGSGGGVILRMAYSAGAHRWEISVTNTYHFPPAIGS